MTAAPEIWMLDLDETLRPWRAHLIVEDHGTYRVTACGERSRQTYGWASTNNGDLPLSGPHDVHCGRTPDEIVAYRTAKGWVAIDEVLARLS